MCTSEQPTKATKERATSCSPSLSQALAEIASLKKELEAKNLQIQQQQESHQKAQKTIERLQETNVNLQENNDLLKMEVQVLSKEVLFCQQRNDELLEYNQDIFSIALKDGVRSESKELIAPPQKETRPEKNSEETTVSFEAKIRNQKEKKRKVKTYSTSKTRTIGSTDIFLRLNQKTTASFKAKSSKEEKLERKTITRKGTRIIFKEHGKVESVFERLSSNRTKSFKAKCYVLN